MGDIIIDEYVFPLFIYFYYYHIFFMQLVSSLLSSDTHAKQTGEGVWSIRTTYFSFSLPAEDETRDGSLGNMGSLEDNI